MKRFPVVALIALLIPLAANAGNFHTARGNMYQADGAVVVNSPVEGDLVVAGGSVVINQQVLNDVLAVGGAVQILGPVGGDVRAAGGNVTIGGHVRGDVVVAGGNVRVLSTAVIEGDLTYRSPNQATIEPGARIKGRVSTSARPVQHRKGSVAALFLFVLAVLTAVKMLMYLGATALVVWLWRRQATAFLHEVRTRFWPSAGRGVVYALLVPIACALLVMSLVGAVPGIVGGMAYIALLFVSRILAGMFLGAWVAQQVYHRPALRITWVNALLGTLGIGCLTIIPFFGAIAKLVISAAVFGALCDSIRRRILT